MGRGRMKSEAGCGLCCYFVLLIVSVILFGCSFDTLDVNKVGIDFNGISRSYGTEKIYGPGRYFLGLGHAIVDFGTTWEKLEFCEGCEDGNAITGRAPVGSSETAVSVNVALTVFYRLRYEKVLDIINFFPTKNWKIRYVTIVKNAVAVTIGSGKLTVDNFIEDRPYVTKMIAWAINERLLPVYAYTMGCYINEVSFGASRDSAIEQNFINQQISNRRAITSSVEGQTLVIVAQANQNVSAIDADVRQLLDDTFRVTNFTVATYAAMGQKVLLGAEGQGYLYLQNKLNMTQTELMQYIYVDKIGSSMGSTVAGFKDVAFREVTKLV